MSACASKCMCVRIHICICVSVHSCEVWRSLTVENVFNYASSLKQGTNKTASALTVLYHQTSFLNIHTDTISHEHKSMQSPPLMALSQRGHPRAVEIAESGLDGHAELRPTDLAGEAGLCTSLIPA